MIYTSSFHNSSSLPSELNQISISERVPRGFMGEIYAPLMPSSQIIDDYNQGNISWDVFRSLFYGYLLGLDADETAKLLFGSILLSFDFHSGHSHRQIITDWLREYGYEIEELGKRKSRLGKDNILLASL